jgi:hypothetical protein
MKRSLLMLMLVSCVAACSSGSSSRSSDNDPKVTPTTKTPREQLAACVGTTSQAELDNNLRTASYFEDSAHEMVVCGGISFAFIQVIVDMGINLVTDPSSTPTEVIPFQDGVYKSSTSGYKEVKMDVELFAGSDYSFAKQGERIPFNVQDASNYLVGGKVTVDLVKQTASVSYQSAGPLIELLGFGANPPNPLAVSLSDLKKLSSEFGKVTMASTVYVNDEKGTSTFTYALTTPKQPVSSIFNAGRFTYQMDSVSGTRSDNKQSMKSSTWDIAYEDSVHGLDGTMAMDFTGGVFPYRATFAYPKSKKPVVSYSCLP